MGKRLPHTPQSQIVAALRRLWLRSRERSATAKRDNYTCQKCGRKQSVAKDKKVKIHVHHKNGIHWKNMVKYIRRQLLVDPKYLETLCEDCHKEEHK